MRKTGIIVKTGTDDSFDIERNDLDILHLVSVTDKKKSSFLKHNIIRLLLSKHAPSEATLDFLNLALAIYSADQLISRKQRGYLGWNRMIEIYLPVFDVKSWQTQKERLEKMIGFLSGDKWLFHFRRRKSYGLENNESPGEISRASLFSGGLDSYIGAIDMLSGGGKIAFVGHHKGGANELPYQKELINGLKSEYAPTNIEEFLFHVQPEKIKDSPFTGETSQRARSILFLALGIAVANSHGATTELVVPENGLISLNVPLTKSRIGSLSTRTTHPYFFWLINNVLPELGIDNRVFNPYRFSTKGEMLQKCRNQALVKASAQKTVSCSKPGHYKRWNRGKNIHCGHCAPCIIRRASMAKLSIDDGSKYEFDILKNTPKRGSSQGYDYNAFKTALGRIHNGKVTLLDIAIAGPLPGDDETLKKQKDVYLRGMKEVQTLFQAI